MKSNKDELKEKLRERAFDCGMDYFGVSPAKRFANIIEGHRPNDLLPSAKNVIVLGFRIPTGAIRANNRAFEGLRHGIFSYVNFGYNKVNEWLDHAALSLVRYLEQEHDYVSYPIPSGGPRDEYLMMGAMSNRFAAVCAGLGQFGWSGFVLTPKDGPRVRWVSIITEAELEGDPLYEDRELCKGDACRKCVKACPVDALSMDDKILVGIDDLRTAYSARNKALCRCATKGLVKGTPGRLQADVPLNLNTMEKWLELSKKDDPWQRMEITRGIYCHRCMIECPVGKSSIQKG